VEIVLSFVLFVGVLIFIFSIMNPTKTSVGVLELRSLEKELMNNISISVEKLSIVVGSKGDCYTKSVVEAIGGNRYVEYQDPKNPRRYTIYFNDIFEERGNVSCLAGDINFTIGTSMNETIIYYENLKKLKEHYENEYNSLKNNLEIAGDFAFKFKYINEKSDVWWNENWQRRKRINITGIGSFVNFPVYINVAKENEMRPEYTDLRFVYEGEELDYEIEMAIVVGKKGKNIPKEKAYEYVAGYMIINDLSARDIQHKEMEKRLQELEGRIELVADPRNPHPKEDRLLQQRTALEAYDLLADLTFLAEVIGVIAL